MPPEHRSHYGYDPTLTTKAVPAGAPPLFLAATQDDNAIPVGQSVGVSSNWTAAHIPAELHLYQQGGHGFGMLQQNLPVDHWTLAFEGWPKAGGWIKAPKMP